MRQSETAATALGVVERLKRLDIIYPRSPIYFVTACTVQRRSLLTNDLVHDAFRAFALSGAKHGSWLGAYVLMPNHFHAFVALDSDIKLAGWMKSLKGTLSAAMRTAGVRPPYWQKGFFDHILRSSESYEEKWHYVRENPVRAGLVQNWEAWRYQGEIFPLEFD